MDRLRNASSVAVFAAVELESYLTRGETDFTNTRTIARMITSAMAPDEITLLGQAISKRYDTSFFLERKKGKFAERTKEIAGRLEGVQAVKRRDVEKLRQFCVDLSSTIASYGSQVYNRQYLAA